MANIRDFYTINESDPIYQPDQTEVHDEIESIVNQTKMTLLTNKGEVLGEDDFGLNIEHYLFDFDLNPFELSEEAHEQIGKYVTGSKRHDISVTPSYIEDSKSRQTYAMLISIDENLSRFAVLYNS